MKKLTAFPAVLVAFVFSACNADAGKTDKAATPEPVTEEQKTVYSLGLLLSQSLRTFNLSPEELALVQKGIKDGVGDTKPTINAEEFIPKIQELQTTRMTAAGKAYLEKAAKEAGATTTASGIVIKHTQTGTGAQPGATDQVKVHYEGKFVDGKVFDSSLQRGEPITFGLDGVIPCWTEGVQTMKVGGKAQISCPSDLAYGPQGRPNIPPNSVLVFDVELLEVTKAPATAAPAK
jgi:FKBP-type peptidyl-prolyl cis-trans isomerase